MEQKSSHSSATNIAHNDVPVPVNEEPQPEDTQSYPVEVKFVDMNGELVEPSEPEVSGQVIDPLMLPLSFERQYTVRENVQVLRAEPSLLKQVLLRNMKQGSVGMQRFQMSPAPALNTHQGFSRFGERATSSGSLFNEHKFVRVDHGPAFASAGRPIANLGNGVALGERRWVAGRPFGDLANDVTLGGRLRSPYARKMHLACNLCPAKFTKNSNLVIHKRTHTGEKPFACDLCEARFAQKSNLTTHKKKHGGDRPYVYKMAKRNFDKAPTSSNNTPE